MAGLSFLAYLIAFLIIGWLVWSVVSSLIADGLEGSHAYVPPPRRDLHWRDFNPRNWRIRDVRPKCYGGCGTVVRGTSHCAACEAKRLADHAAQREKDRAYNTLANELARRERQKERRAAKKLAQTTTPKTGPIVVPKGQPYRP